MLHGGFISHFAATETHVVDVKWKKTAKNLVNPKKSSTFALALETVPWMSGLVNGLQNRLRRFESARHLREKWNSL